MKFLLVNAGNEGHANELVTSFWNEAIKSINVIDTISPFPELFSVIDNGSTHYFLEYIDNEGKKLSMLDRMNN